MRKTPGVSGGWPPAGVARGLAANGRHPVECRDEKAQLSHRLPAEFIRRTLSDFNARALDATTASAHLEVSRARLYELRTAFLRDKADCRWTPSGGDRGAPWPAAAITFLEGFLPLQKPPNFQLVADELERLCGFQRSRSTVEAYVKTHLPHLVPRAVRKPRIYRRFRRAHIGELWQHDSSIHQWWPAPSKQTLLLTLDDASGTNLAGSFVTSDTTWNHFLHFRRAFEQHGIPEVIYTDALSLFGVSSSDDKSDPKSQFQRALKGLGVAHLVAPSPQAKGKIERRFRTFQGRIVTLLAYAKAANYQQADAILQMEIARQNRTTSRATAKVPSEIWQAQTLDQSTHMRPCPPSALLDLHFSLRTSRRVNNDHTIDFEGQNYEISPTTRKFVSIIYHPNLKFWVVSDTPKAIWPCIHAEFSL